MSYNFAISRIPLPDDVQDPWSWINEIVEEEMNDDSTKAHPEFVELHKALTEKYPCICDLPDDEVDDGVWSDGPLINNFLDRCAVLGITYPNVEKSGSDIFSIILGKGFTIFDYQAESIYKNS